jgi:hypothetical protein
VGTLEQLADIFTKPLSSALFEKKKKDYRKLMFQWLNMSGALGEGV